MDPVDNLREGLVGVSDLEKSLDDILTTGAMNETSVVVDNVLNKKVEGGPQMCRAGL